MTTDPDSDPDSSEPYRNIRHSPIAGVWYSSSPPELSQEIDAYLNVPAANLGGSVIGLVAPHAGYRYSGPTAGYAFAAIKGARFCRVVIVSPLHAYHPAPILTSGHSAYATPFGDIPVDQDAVTALQAALAAEDIALPRILNDEEHSLEIELPFLQRSLAAPFQLVPLMVRSQDPSVLERLANCLSEVLTASDTLLVASTDLSHFHPQPAAQKFDAEMLKQIERFSPEGVLSAERSGKGFACGSAAVATVLWAARKFGADAVRILHQSTSAEVTGDFSSVVGYGSAAILKQT